MLGITVRQRGGRNRISVARSSFSGQLYSSNSLTFDIVSKKISHTPACILYVCCGSKCKKRGGKLLYKFLKNAVKEQSLKQEVQVIKTGCTDNCKNGPVVAVMPVNEWHMHVDEGKALGLVEKLSHNFRHG